MHRYLLFSFFLVCGAFSACTSGNGVGPSSNDASAEHDATGDADGSTNTHDGSDDASAAVRELERELGRAVELKITGSPLLASTIWTIPDAVRGILGVSNEGETGPGLCAGTCFQADDAPLDCEGFAGIHVCPYSIRCRETASIVHDALTLVQKFHTGSEPYEDFYDDTLGAFDVGISSLRGHLRSDWLPGKFTGSCERLAPATLTLDVDVTFERAIAGDGGPDADSGEQADGQSPDGGVASSFCITGGTATLTSGQTSRTIQWTACGVAHFVHPSR